MSGTRHWRAIRRVRQQSTRATLRRREEEDQGEEIVLSRRELRRLGPLFEGWRIETFHFLSTAKRLLRGRLKQRAALSVLENADRAMIGAVPPLRWWRGEALIIARCSNRSVATGRVNVRPA